MCELTTIATIASIGSTVMGTVGAFQQASAQKAQAEYNAGIARNNSIMMDQQAKYQQQLAADAEERGRTEEYRTRLRTKQLAGKQRSQQAASGVDISFGTPVDVLGDTYQLGELDALTVRNNAQREASSYRNNATAYTNKATNFSADAALSQSSADQINPWMSAGGVLLDGATTTVGMMDKYGMFKKKNTAAQGGIFDLPRSSISADQIRWN